MMKQLNYYLAISFVILTYVDVTAQNFKKVLEMPITMASPIDQSLEEYNKIYQYRIDERPWVVYSDRAKNKTESGETLDFMQDVLVVDETETKIYIVDAIREGLKIKEITKEYGWIEKNKMLLWGNSLSDPVTKIDRKGFLLNEKESVQRIIKDENNKDRVRIFNTPDAGNDDELEKKRIYEFFFVFKKVPSPSSSIDSMFLLSKNVTISTNTKSDIIGWVQSDRVSEWNTRIALEPNFDQAAYSERKNDVSNKQVIAFSLADYAVQYADNGNIQRDEIIWENDPIKLTEDKLATSDKKRFKGGVVRFPMLDKNERLNFYSTAFVGEITLASLGRLAEEHFNLIEYSNLTKEIDRLNMAKNNINVLFVVDGTAGMEEYLNGISSSILNIQANAEDDGKSIKFGAAIYRDAAEKVNNKHFEYLPLTTRHNDVIDFLEEVKAENISNDDPYEAVFYGIDQALKKAGLKKDQNNIIVLVGDAGDHLDDHNRGNEDFTSIDPFDLQTSVDKWGAHLISLKCPVTSGNAGDAFLMQSEELILETAKLSFNKYKGIGTLVGLDIANPKFIDGHLINGSIYGSALKVSNSRELTNTIEDEVAAAIKFTTDITNVSNKIFEDGSSFGDNNRKDAAGQFGPAVASILYENFRELSQKDIKKLANEKYQFYLEAYVPIKVQGAKYNGFSNVLFLPEDDMESMRDILRRLADTASRTPDEQRESLTKTWLELLRIYTGEKNPENIKAMTLEEVNNRMQGVEKEGITFKVDKKLAKVKITDLKKRKVVSDSEIRAYVGKITANYKQLDEILKQGKNYEFCYTSNGNTYYWIPVDYLP